jgi:hypothetical protein
MNHGNEPNLKVFSGRAVAGLGLFALLQRDGKT